MFSRNGVRFMVQQNIKLTSNLINIFQLWVKVTW